MEVLRPSPHLFMGTRPGAFVGGLKETKSVGETEMRKGEREERHRGKETGNYGRKRQPEITNTERGTWRQRQRDRN